MEYNLFENIAYCKEFVDNAQGLLHYSHIPSGVIALIVGVIVFYKNKNSILGQTLFFISVFYSLWVFLNLTIWHGYASNSVLMFAWAPIELVGLLLFSTVAYFTLIFIRGQGIVLWKKILFFMPILPAIVFSLSQYNLVSYDIQECIAQENPLYLEYVLYIKLFYILCMVGILIYGYIQSRNEKRLQLTFLTIGVLLFALSFFIAGYFSDITGNYKYEMYGMYGMLAFFGILIYLITRFQLFDIKVFATEALVVTLVVVTGSQFAFIQDPTNKILTLVTLIIEIIFGFILIKSVRKEVKQRQEIELLAKNLASSNDNLSIANEKLQELDKLKTEFLSLATHQLRSPLTAIKGYASMILDKTYGEFPETLKEPLTRIFQSTQNLAKVIEDFLNVSKIEQGGMKYQFVNLNIVQLVSQIVKELEILANAKGLELKMENTLSSSEIILGDEQKLRQVFLNFIDNAIKYTASGSILVRIVSENVNHIRIDIKDTGAGISAGEKNKLFQKFGRTQSGKLNTGGSGLGLYLAKKIITDHGGEITIESEGMGKGTTFGVILSKSEDHKVY
jgi:signal transduction histidine kinase